jgi:DNA-binding MurR/RpiR family transcriptional regulator
MAVAQPNLTAKQERALATLVAQPTIAAAAKVLGVGETTLYRYMRDAQFSDALKRARRDAVSQLTTRLQAGASGMAGVLQSIAEDATAPASARVSAARSVIDYTLKAVELEDLSERLDALEKAINEGGNK